MTLTIWTFSGPGETPATEQELSSTRETLTQLAPPGSRVEVRPLDHHYMSVDVTNDEVASRPRFEEDLEPHLDARICATIWLPDRLENAEVAAADVMQALQLLDPQPVTAAVCHSRVHLDLVGDGEPPKAYVVVRITRAVNISRDEFVWYYRTHHVPAAMSVDPLFVRYSTHRVLHARGEFARDTITVQEYESNGDVDRHVRTRLAATKDAGEKRRKYFASFDYYSGDRSLL